jgi:amidohydrolase
MNQEESKRKVRKRADDLREEMTALSLDLFHDPELSGQEHRSVERLCVALKRHGFSVQMGLAGLPTAFTANRPEQKAGPHIAFLAEYDALPQVGHGCGHNLIGTAGTYAGIVAASLADSLGGSISVVGTPAEETIGGKVLLTRAGVFDDFDAAIMVHPSAEDRVHSTSLACSGLEVTFTGKAAHAVAHPEKGINALQPMIRLFVQVEEAKKRWGPEVKTPGVILEGGVRANIVPERTVGQFTVRAPSIHRVHEVRAEIEQMVEHVASEAGVEFGIRPTDEPYFEMVTNKPLAEAYRVNLAELGRTAVDGPRVNQGSLDMGNVSYVCPSIHPFVSICDPDLASHTQGFGQASVSARGQSALLDSVKAMAMTAVDLMLSPELVREARQAFETFRAERAPEPEAVR